MVAINKPEPLNLDVIIDNLIFWIWNMEINPISNKDVEKLVYNQLVFVSNDIVSGNYKSKFKKEE